MFLKDDPLMFLFLKVGCLLVVCNHRKLTDQVGTTRTVSRGLVSNSRARKCLGVDFLEDLAHAIEGNVTVAEKEETLLKGST